MVFLSSFMLHFKRQNNKHVNQPSVEGHICYTRNYTLEKVRKLYDHWYTSELCVIILINIFLFLKTISLRYLCYFQNQQTPRLHQQDICSFTSCIQFDIIWYVLSAAGFAVNVVSPFTLHRDEEHRMRRYCLDRCPRLHLNAHNLCTNGMFHSPRNINIF